MPCSISTFSIIAPTSNRELNGFGLPETMLCDLFGAMRTTPDDQACFGRILPDSSAILSVQNRSLTSIIFCPCFASRASTCFFMRYPFLSSLTNNDYPVCMKRERQTVYFCIRSSRCFFNPKQIPLSSLPLRAVS